MPSALTYPGVYIEERASGVRTITGVATSIAAFVDSFPRGPLNEAVQCLGYADFEREFGGIHTTSEASYGIKQFFQNGGAECWVVRVATLDSATAAENAIEARAMVEDSLGTAMFRVLAGRRLRGAIATDPGDWGNHVFLEVDYDTSAPTETFNLSITEQVIENGRRRVLRNEVFRNLTMELAAPNYAVDTVNETSRIVQLDRFDLTGTALGALTTTAPFPRPAVSGSEGADLPMPPAIPPNTSTFEVTVANDTDPAVPRTTHTATLSYAGAAPLTYQALRPYIESAIRALALPALAETERSLLAGATVRLLGKGTAASPYRFVVQGGRGSPDYLAGSTLTIEATIAQDMGFPTGSIANVQQYQLADGLDGLLPVDDVALIGSEAPKTGIYALEDVDLVNILCIPHAADLDGTNMRAVYDQAAVYMASRRGFLLIDIPPATATLDAMQTWMTENDSLRSRDAAVYFPRTFVPDPANGNRLRSIGASGTIAGLYARTDATRGVWKAPAGTDAKLENVQALAYALTDLQNGALNPLGVNCLRTFPGYSHISWGARTLEGADTLASEWKYIPIRRLALYIEESLFRGTKWVVFEPNDEPLWAQIRLNVGVFMNGLFRQGAFQGKTPQEAYFVKCDKETTTQADRNLGIVNILVGFAPLKPAEFVVLTIQQIAGDLQ